MNRGTKRGRHLYKEAQRLWRTGKPIVAAVHGAAVGAGVGLAVMADFRVTCPEARFSVNFTRLGFHPGFGLTASLPRLIGAQQASLLMYTGRRMTGEQALAIGLADYCVPLDQVRSRATELATEIAQSAPLAIVATRETLRRGLAEAVASATEREYEEQDWLRNTEDFREGVKAMARAPAAGFQGAVAQTLAVVILPRTPSLRLDGRRALVTGAGRGIGLAAAAALAQAGAHVVLAARTAAEIEAASAQIVGEGGSAEALVLDVTDLRSVRAAVDALAPFDVLVNNAGTNRPAPFLEVTEQDYDAITRLNQRAAFFVAQAVARRMVQARCADRSSTFPLRWAMSAALGARSIA